MDRVRVRARGRRARKGEEKENRREEGTEDRKRGEKKEKEEVESQCNIFYSRSCLQWPNFFNSALSWLPIPFSVLIQ